MSWYDRPWVMWTCLVLFPPAGLVLLFLNREQYPKWKIIMACGLVWLTICIALPKTKPHKEAPPTQATTQQEAPKPPSSKEDEIKAAVAGVINPENIETINYAPYNNFILIKFRESPNITHNMTVNDMYIRTKNILKTLKPLTDMNIGINIVYPLEDRYGNSMDVIVIKATYSHETLQKINFDKFQYENIPKVADEWWNHPAVNLTE